MRFVNRILMACFAALICSLPATSSMGGGGGDSGVWILPNCLPVTLVQGGGPVLRAPRAEFTVAALNCGAVMVMPARMGRPVCLLYEVPTNQGLPTAVAGNRVSLSPQTLIAIRDGSGRAEGLIIDQDGNGFIVRATWKPNVGVTLEVF